MGFTFERRHRLGLPVLFLAFFLSILSSSPAKAAENNWWDFLTHNARISPDVSFGVLSFNSQSKPATIGFFGIDLHKVFSRPRGDIGTLVMQVYLARNDLLPDAPAVFDDNHDWAVVYREFAFNYTQLGQYFGKYAPNVKVGRYKVPFGLEHTVNTTGTLHQFNSDLNLGLKGDIGVSLNDDLANLEYELSASQATNQPGNHEHGDFVYAGRIGSPRTANLIAGSSILKSTMKGIDRRRLGVDLQWYTGFSFAKFDVSGGTTNGSRTNNVIVELGRYSRTENSYGYLQIINYRQKLETSWLQSRQIALGTQFTPSRNLTVATLIGRIFTDSFSRSDDTVISVQLRYRWFPI